MSKHKSLSWDMEPDVWAEDEAEQKRRDAERHIPPEHREPPTWWDKELIVTDEIRQKVEQYHLIEQGDKQCHISRVIRGDNGWPYLFVRVINAQGERWRCIEEIDSLTDSVVEVMSCRAGDEADMICVLTGGKTIRQSYERRRPKKTAVERNESSEGKA